MLAGSVALLLTAQVSRHAFAAEPAADLPDIQVAKALKAPRPEYPYEARRSLITGTGVVVVEVDPPTGKVTRAYMAQSTGSRLLDDAALSAFRRWEFTPGTVARMRTPITFTMFNGRPSTEYSVKSKSMDDVLAAFLGKGTVVRGPIPAYPRNQPWVPREGKGVYELHADAAGKVENVRVLKSSGDPTFDRVASDTLRKWRLRRGPLVLELPLAFTLTPTSYSVDVRR